MIPKLICWDFVFGNIVVELLMRWNYLQKKKKKRDGIIILMTYSIFLEDVGNLFRP